LGGVPFFWYGPDRFSYFAPQGQVITDEATIVSLPVLHVPQNYRKLECLRVLNPCRALDSFSPHFLQDLFDCALGIVETGEQNLMLEEKWK
jgi:hypothetical protein